VLVVVVVVEAFIDIAKCMEMTKFVYGIHHGVDLLIDG